jgi:hypothetical protein
MNDPVNLHAYSQLLLFKNDLSRENVLFSSKSSSEQRSLQAIAHGLSLEYEYSVTARNVRISRPFNLPTATGSVEVGSDDLEIPDLETLNEAFTHEDFEFLDLEPNEWNHNPTKDNPRYLSDSNSILRDSSPLATTANTVDASLPHQATSSVLTPNDSDSQPTGHEYHNPSSSSNHVGDFHTPSDILPSYVYLPGPAAGQKRRANSPPGDSGIELQHIRSGSDLFRRRESENLTFPAGLYLSDLGAMSSTKLDQSISPKLVYPRTVPLGGTSKPIAQRYACNSCPGTFELEEHLKHHATSHNARKELQCPDCDTTFIQADLLIRHQRMFHAPPGDSLGSNASAPQSVISSCSSFSPWAANNQTKSPKPPPSQDYCGIFAKDYDPFAAFRLTPIVGPGNTGSTLPSGSHGGGSNFDSSNKEPLSRGESRELDLVASLPQVSSSRRGSAQSNLSAVSSGYQEIVFDSNSVHSGASQASVASGRSGRRGPLSEYSRAGMKAVRKLGGACWRCKFLRKTVSVMIGSFRALVNDT